MSERESITEYIEQAIRQFDVGILSNIPERVVGSMLILNVLVEVSLIMIMSHAVNYCFFRQLPLNL